jgi:hypothetical protein
MENGKLTAADAEGRGDSAENKFNSLSAYSALPPRLSAVNLNALYIQLKIALGVRSYYQSSLRDFANRLREIALRARFSNYQPRYLQLGSGERTSGAGHQYRTIARQGGAQRTAFSREP